MSRPAQVNLEDVARRAGVSLATASRVLRGNVKVSEALRARVLAAVDELGYQPNPLVASLMRQVRARHVPSFRGLIAYVAAHPERGFWERDRVGHAFRAGAEEEARRHGYRLEFFLPKVAGLNAAQLTRQLHARGVAGVVLHGSRIGSGDSAQERVDPSRLPVVLVGHKEEKPTLNFAMADQYANARLVARRLAALGYRRPLFVFSDYLHEISEGRFAAGFSSGCEVAELRPELCRLDSTEVMKPAGEAAFLRRLREARPDVVASMLNRVPQWLEAAGLRAPRDLGYATLDLDAAAPEGTAGLDQRHAVVGAQATAQLVEQIERGELGVAPVVHGRLVEGVWRDGTSLRAQ